MRTGESPKPTLRLVGDGEGESGSALELSGLERADGTTLPTTQTPALLESLNYLERETQTLESRFYEVCATLNLVMGHLVERRLFTIDTTTTEGEKNV